MTGQRTYSTDSPSEAPLTASAGCEMAALTGGGVIVSSSIETTSGVGNEYATCCIAGGAKRWQSWSFNGAREFRDDGHGRLLDALDVSMAQEAEHEQDARRS